MTTDPLPYSLQASWNPRQAERIKQRQQNELATLGPLPKVHGKAEGQVIFSAVTPSALRGRGKVEPDVFLPPFMKALAEDGWSSSFIFDEEELLAKTQKSELPIALINLYNEERPGIPNTQCMRDAQRNAVVVFNPVQMGKTLGYKPDTNNLYAASGIPVPEMYIGPDDKVFSNAIQNTSQAAWVTASLTPEEEGRYNTRFIETQRAFEGHLYRNTVRVLACGPHIVHGFVGLRRVSDIPGQASVHGVNTPPDPDLVSYFFEELFEKRRADLEVLTRKINDVIGPGFYHHDLLINSETDEIYVCETGIKFDAFAFHGKMTPILAQTPCLHLLEPMPFARRSAKAVLEIILTASAA